MNLIAVVPQAWWARFGFLCRLTVEMSGVWRRAKHAVRRPLDGRVRHYSAPGENVGKATLPQVGMAPDERLGCLLSLTGEYS